MHIRRADGGRTAKLRATTAGCAISASTHAGSETTRTSIYPVGLAPGMQDRETAQVARLPHLAGVPPDARREQGYDPSSLQNTNRQSKNAPVMDGWEKGVRSCAGEPMRHVYKKGIHPQRQFPAHVRDPYISCESRQWGKVTRLVDYHKRKVLCITAKNNSNAYKVLDDLFLIDI